MYQAPKKPPPANKRHTKPCKYFQARKCPHPADVCDFAHVAPALPVGRKSLVMCRYDAAGHCKSGSLCHYTHRSDAYEGILMDEVLIADPEPRPEWQSMGSPGGNTYAEHPPFGYPYSTPWGSSNVINLPFYPSNSTIPHAIDSSPVRSRYSICTTTSMSSTDSDDVVVVTEAPCFNEHSHVYQSQVRVVDLPSPTHVPPFYPTLNTSFSGIHTPTRVDPKPQVTVGSRASSRSSMRPKPLKYKTKPCKFFNRETGCPSGEECTFRHNEQVHSNTPKNYFPISWRVIGGGVLIGGKKTDCELEEASVSSSESLGSLNLSLPKPTDLALPKTFARQRSNSIPPTPTTAQVKVESLFSAESPGVL